MIITKNKSTKKIIFIVAFCLAIAIGAAFGVAYKLKLLPYLRTQQTKPSYGQTIQPNNTPSPKTAPPVAAQDNTSTALNKTTNQIPSSAATTVSITQLNEQGNQITVAALVNNTIKQGTCVINFTSPNDRPVTRQVDATLKDTQAVCGPVNLSNLEFSYLGTWNVTVTYFANNEQAHANGTIDIK